MKQASRALGEKDFFISYTKADQPWAGKCCNFEGVI